MAASSRRSQAGHAHNFRLRRSERTKNAVALEEIAADVDALMAGDASVRFEQPITVQLFGREREASPPSQWSKRLPGVRRDRT